MGCGQSVSFSSGLIDEKNKVTSSQDTDYGIESSPPENSELEAPSKASKIADDEVIRGNVNVECPSTARIVRIFTSSTFTDTRHERNALMERVYPRLKELCQQLGYEFQIVDMRWGIRDESTDDHMGTELCLREVEQCKKLSTGPYFVTFLSHKYGYRAFPNKIEAGEFELLYSGVQDDKSRQLLDLWFKKDDNAVPSTYVLQPISSVLPDFWEKDEEKRKSARSAWYEQSSLMQDALATSSSENLDSKHAHRYLVSVTEAEIQLATAGTPDTLANCLWFHRIIENIDEQPSSYILSRYKECNGPEEKVKESQNLLKELRDTLLPQRIKTDNHMKYSIQWTDKGVDPEKNKDHKKYIAGLCEDFEKKVSQMIRDAIEQRKKTDLANPLYAEIVEHTVFCQEKCKAFHGRQGTLDMVAGYLLNDSNTPFVVHGPSGCGKTSIVAMAAKLVLERLGQNTRVVIRFIGTTPESSTIGALLSSLIRQIWRVYRKTKVDRMPVTIKGLAEKFHKGLNFATAEKPLVLLLDTLDQFDPSNGARQLEWLPKELPNHVKMILSTLPEPEYESFPKLKDMFKTTVKTNFLEVPKLEDNDVEGILNKWLSSNHRSLTTSQRQVVLDAFHKCPLPLFLKLSFDEACRWPSFAGPSQTVLEESVRGSINALFERVEGLHGNVFVSRALAYLTMSKTGLSESELEDILSCDDDVLNDVYTYWTPPIRRLPPLLLVRLKAELGQYLVDRGADGVRVFFWYHRQFIEAATDRYCKEAEFNQKLHSALADFFVGTWACGKSKSYLSRDGKEDSADRKVASQPDKFSTGYNLRKLNNLPYQRTEAQELDKLKKECLLNFSFLAAKLQALGLRYILDDFTAAREVYPEDEQLKTVGECLQLSQDALLTYSKELPSQLLNRLAKAQKLEDFLKDCAEAPDYYLLPSRPILKSPGDQLVHCMAGHHGRLDAIDMTIDGNFVMTCATDRKVKIWDVRSGTLVRSVNLEHNPRRVLFCSGDTIFVVQTDDSIMAFKMSSWTKVYDAEYKGDTHSICVGGKDKQTLGVFGKHCLFLHEVSDGGLIKCVHCDLLQENQTFANNKPCIGSLQYMAIPDNYKVELFIFDLITNTFIKKIYIGKLFEMAFSNSGDMLYTRNSFTMEFKIYNTKTTEEIKVYKGVLIGHPGDMKLTREHNLYFNEDRKLVVFDLVTGERTPLLKLASGTRSVVLQDMTRAVSISDDRVVRVFDLTRKANEDLTEDQECLTEDKEYLKDAIEENDEKKAKAMKTTWIRSFKTLPNPRYVLVDKMQSLISALQIYDLALDRPVKNILVNKRTRQVEPLKDGKHILVAVGRRIKMVDMVSSQIVRRFQGKIPRRGVPAKNSFIFVREGKEIATRTRGGRGIKLLSIATGKVVHIFRWEEVEKFDHLTASARGGILLAYVGDGSICVFDVIGRTNMYRVPPEFSGTDTYYVDDALVTNDDAFIITQCEKVPSECKERNMDAKVWFCVCLDVKEEQVQMECVDYISYWMYQFLPGRTRRIEFALLDNRTLVISNWDAVLLVFDIISGEMKHRIYDHPCARLKVSEGGPFFLSQGLYVGDKTLKLIDKTSFKTVATFSPDTKVSSITMSKDGYHAIGYFDGLGHPVVWKLGGGPEHDPYRKSFKSLSNYPDIYGTELVRTTLKLAEDDDDKDDNDDADDDDDDDDEDDDDDDYDDDDDDTDDDDENLSDPVLGLIQTR